MSDGGETSVPAADHASRAQRTLTALRARDWLGIAIELVVVIVGILIAFQISEWGEQQRQAREERQFLERLHGEYRRGIAELEGLVSYHRIATRDIRQAFTARGDPFALERYRRQDNYGCATARLPAAPFNDTAFEELLSSGRLNLIGDERLRSEIRDLATAQAAASKQVDAGRQLVLNQLNELNAYYRFDMRRDGQVSCGIDWAGLLAKPTAVNAILRAYRVHYFTLTERLKVLSLTRRVLNDLACKLGKPDCKR